MINDYKVKQLARQFNDKDAYDCLTGIVNRSAEHGMDAEKAHANMTIFARIALEYTPDALKALGKLASAYSRALYEEGSLFNRGQSDPMNELETAFSERRVDIDGICRLADRVFHGFPFEDLALEEQKRQERLDKKGSR